MAELVGIAAVAVLRKSATELAPRLALSLSVGLLIAHHVVTYDAILLAVPLALAFRLALRRDVVFAGMTLVLGLSLGPWPTYMQVDRWGYGINVSTAALLGVTALFAFWVRTSEPFFLDVSDGPSDGEETSAPETTTML